MVCFTLPIQFDAKVLYDEYCDLTTLVIIGCILFESIALLATYPPFWNLFQNIHFGGGKCWVHDFWYPLSLLIPKFL